MALLRAYDRCCAEHQGDIRYVANLLSTLCEAHPRSAAIIHLPPRGRIPASK